MFLDFNKQHLIVPVVFVVECDLNASFTLSLDGEGILFRRDGVNLAGPLVKTAQKFHGRPTTQTKQILNTFSRALAPP